MDALTSPVRSRGGSLATRHYLALLVSSLIECGLANRLLLLIFSDRVHAASPLVFDALLLLSELSYAAHQLLQPSEYAPLTEALTQIEETATHQPSCTPPQLPSFAASDSARKPAPGVSFTLLNT